MAQVFHRSTNTLAMVSIVGGLFGAAALGGIAYKLNISPYYTDVGVPKEQVVAFSHKHHVQDIGLDCRYCHTSVEESSFAGIPPTKTCMNCHSEIWKDADILEPVRESYRNDTPLEWVRIHDLPDYVYFDHSVHINKGIGCVSCHGRVDEMPLMWKEETLHMTWCLQCHRNPEKHIRPKDKIFDLAWQPDSHDPELRSRLIEEYDVKGRTSCSVCHR